MIKEQKINQTNHKNQLNQGSDKGDMSKKRKNKISECCDILDNLRVPINDEIRQTMQGNIPYYGANGIQGYINKYIFDEDLILLAEDGGNFEEYHTRPIAYKISGKSWVNNHAHILRAKQEFNQDYIFYSLVHKDITKYLNSGTRSKLNKSELEKIEIVFPETKAKEDKIARFLSTCDAIIEKTQSAIAKYKAIKQGMLQDLFTRGIDPNTNKLRPRYQDAPELYKESKLGCIPREWDCDSIDNLTDKVGSGVTPTGGSEVYKTQGILFLRSQNILFGKLSLNDVAFISKEIDEVMENSRVKPFDVLLNITGASIGRSAFFPEELTNANVNQHVCIIRFKKSSKSLAVFASEYLNTDFGQRQMYKAMAVGNREGLNYQQIKAFNFPDIKNQKELEKIASIIENINHKLQTEQTYLQKMQMVKKGLMEDLLSGKKQVLVKNEIEENESKISE